MPAVIGSRDRLWSIFGNARGLPPADLTYEQDRADLARHEAQIHNHESFDDASLREREAELPGCLLHRPAERTGADADVSW